MYYTQNLIRMGSKIGTHTVPFWRLYLFLKKKEILKVFFFLLQQRRLKPMLPGKYMVGGGIPSKKCLSIINFEL